MSLAGHGQEDVSWANGHHGRRCRSKSPIAPSSTTYEVYAEVTPAAATNDLNLNWFIGPTKTPGITIAQDVTDETMATNYR